MGAAMPDIDMVPTNLEFSVFAGEEIKRLSVVKVITGLTFDPLGHPFSGGLYDNLMGTYGKRMETCATCLNIQTCPGHLGHIELNTLVYNPFFVKLVQRILNIFCLKCFKIQMKDHLHEIFTLQLRLIDAGYIIEAQTLEMLKSENANQDGDNLVKLENGDYVNSYIAQMYQLLESRSLNRCNNTKTSCAIRSAVVHAALQRSPNTQSKCIHCNEVLRNVRCSYHRLVYYIGIAEIKTSLPETAQSAGQNKVIFADECRKFLRNIYENYSDLLTLLCPAIKMSKCAGNNGYPVDIFFMDTIPVTPPKARPSNVLRDQIVEHPQTAIYRNIIENNSVLRVIMRHIKGEKDGLTEETMGIYDSIKGSSQYEKLYNAWQALQTSVDTLLDVNMSKEALSSHGLKQVLEKKDGLIRKHMMGKRVNYAARTVITPDPNINVEEVGVPDIFARKLSYPVVVTPWNVAELRKLVLNGPNVHPGANYIQDEKGSTILIPGDNASKRESIAKLLFSYPEKGLKVVHRHVLNGDVLLLNRQPSLHRPSIMAHKARILPGEKTFRLHYSNCKAYNADFDGDEMNAHYPQSEVARSEAYNLVNVANNYLVPKDGTPLGGLIQDHIISGVKISVRGRFFNREDYQQFVYQGLSHTRRNIKLLPPSIMKPIMLWSGKQILSTIIINLIPEGCCQKINLNSSAKISSKIWSTCPPKNSTCGTDVRQGDMCESQIVIREGELLVGVLDKQQYGATTYGLIHCVYELYGGDTSTLLLTAFTKLFTTFLRREGFTLGVQDILINANADAVRRTIIKECREIGNSAVASALQLKDVPPFDILATKMAEAYSKDPQFRVILDRKYKSLLDSYTNDINKTCLPDGLISKFPFNNLQLMVLSGAKGSMVNTMQISSLLGQIELEGKRPPLMISGKSLPSFTCFETSPKSGGFIDGRFMTGIQPQDFFFHCMAGREGLIDTAVKTSRSGYLQRCLIKHLEGLTIGYDLTVRDSDNTVIQYLYGEDGLDVLKSKFFSNNFGIQFLADNASIILRPQELADIKNSETLSKVMRHVKRIRSWKKKYSKTNSSSHRSMLSAFAAFSEEYSQQPYDGNRNEINPNTGRRCFDEKILELWQELDETCKDIYRKNTPSCPDPSAAVYKQDYYYGAVSEKLEATIDDFVNKNPNRDKSFADVMYAKNIKALAAPGDPVGLLAAQSIGEPSTQMTLNTFHFAGRGEMNVTLGIPRLREILMLASSNIKTPSMDIPIKPDKMKKVNELRTSLNRVSLADVLQFVSVKIKLVLRPEHAYQYQLRFQFLPREAYQDDFNVRPKYIMKYMSGVFFKRLFRALIKSSKEKLSGIDIGENKTKANESPSDDLDGDDEKCDPEKKSSTKAVAVGADNENYSSEEENGNEDNDATSMKLKSRKQDETEYDDPEDADEPEAIDEDETLGLDLDEENGTLNTELAENIDMVMRNEMVNEYVYDKEKYLWCKLTFNLNMAHKKLDMSSIIRELAKKCVVHEVDNIKRAIVYKEKDMSILKTDGVNIVDMFKYNNVLDLNRLYSNDIHAIAKTYGIEAAAKVISKEISNVFGVYGIAVDQRHLSLIADYMTYDGTFQPLSRKGMEHSSSPLQQMSFESCLQFLKSATGSGRVDELNSPSSRLMVGLPIKNGTGAFELLTKIC